MAGIELLLRGRDYPVTPGQTDGDPVDKAVRYRSGYILEVRPAGFEWGTKIQPPEFYILSVHHNGRNLNQLLNFYNKFKDGELEGWLRVWRIDVDNVPQAVKDKWDTDGIAYVGNHPEAVATWADFRSRFRNQNTGQPEQGGP